MKSLGLIFLLFSFCCFAQVKSDYLLVLVNFSKPMDISVYQTDNYKVIGNDGDTLTIYKVVQVRANNDAVLVAIYRPFDYSDYYTITVSNVFDVEGHEINYEENSYLLEME